MTLISMLRRAGIDVPRGVSVDGRILTGSAATTAIAAGTAHAVARHAFHGGDDPFECPSARPALSPEQRYADAWWNVDNESMLADIDTVRTWFPGFVLDDDDGGYDWVGTINSGFGQFRVRIVGSPAGDLPAVVPVAPHALGRHEGRRGFRRAPHLYTSGNLCVADVAEWDPEEHDTATVVAWAAHWFAAYTEWRFGGTWPTDGYLIHAAA